MPFDAPELSGEGPVAQAANALLRHESVIERKALLQAALELAAFARDLDRMRSNRNSPSWSSRAVSSPSQGGSVRNAWTTPGVAACEAAMLRAAGRLQERDWFDDQAITEALANAPHLVAEQQAAMRHATSRDGVVILEAGAGTGKTTTAKALVEAAHGSGLKVIGLAPSWIAADELGRSTGISAQAIARWRHDCAHGRAEQLDTKTLLVVDEAGMLGTRDMEAVLTAAHQAVPRWR